MSTIQIKRFKPQFYVQFMFICLFVFSAVKISGTSFIRYVSVIKEPITGEWVAEFNQKIPNEVQLTIIRGNPVSGDGTRSSEIFSVDELPGLSKDNGQQNNVKFSLAREAGTFQLEGLLREGKGNGTWTLIPNQAFISSMQSRGYDLGAEKDLFRAALFNVNTKAIEELKSFGYENLSLEDLVRSNIFKVTGEFIGEMKSAGFENLDFEDLIRARIFKIDTQFVNEVRAMGFERQPLNTLIDMRLARITPEFAGAIKAEGFPSISPRELIELKTHGVDRDYIRRVKAKGFADITLKQLVEFRVREIVK